MSKKYSQPLSQSLTTIVRLSTLLIITLYISFSFGCSIAANRLAHFDKQSHETAAIQALQKIHRAEASYYSRKSKFTTLNDLVTEELLNKNYGEGKVISGYTYTSADVTTNAFTIHADRDSDGSGNRDFNVTEKGDVYYIENKSAKGTVPHGQGQPLTE